MREPKKRGGGESEAYAVARRFLRQSAGGLSREGSKSAVEMFDKLRREELVERINTVPQLSSKEKAEIVAAVVTYKPAKTKTGPDPRELEFRNFVICWVIQGIEQLGYSNFRARAIVVEVLAEQGDGLGEDSVKNIWDSRTTLSVWPGIVAMGVWPGLPNN